MAEETFAVRDLIEVKTGSYKGRHGSIMAVPDAPGVFYDVQLWPRKAEGRPGQFRYVPSAPAAGVQLTAGQMRVLPKDAEGGSHE